MCVGRAAPTAADGATTTKLADPQPTDPNWTAPPGTYAMPKSVIVRSAVTVDLSAATITGTSNYLFTLQDGGRLTLVGGRLIGPIQGLVLDAVTDGGTGAVTVSGTTLHDVRSIVLAKSQGGPIDVRLTGVHAEQSRRRRTCGRERAGGPRQRPHRRWRAAGGYPAGFTASTTTPATWALPASSLNVSDSTITGFTSSQFQGDSILGETRVATRRTSRTTCSATTATAAASTRRSRTRRSATTSSTATATAAIASHYGTLRSSGNTIYQTALTAGGKVGQAYQATGRLIATGDTVVLTPGALLAYATYTSQRDSGPLSTYPRVGAITLTGVDDQKGTHLTGPTLITSAPGYTPTIVIN